MEGTVECVASSVLYFSLLTFSCFCPFRINGGDNVENMNKNIGGRVRLELGGERDKILRLAPSCKFWLYIHEVQYAF